MNGIETGGETVQNYRPIKFLKFYTLKLWKMSKFYDFCEILCLGFPPPKKSFYKITQIIFFNMQKIK